MSDVLGTFYQGKIRRPNTSGSSPGFIPGESDPDPVNPGGIVGHSPLTLGSETNGLVLDVANQVLELGLASSGVTGALSGTDWNTFNGKIGGAIASGQVAFGTGANEIGGDSGLTWDNANGHLLLGGISTILTRNEIRLFGTSGGLLRFYSGSVNEAIIYTDTNNLQIRPLTSTSQTNIWGGGITRWSVLNSGILQSNGSQTIQTSTGDLRLQTNGGNVIIGSGTSTERLDVIGRIRARTIDNLGTAPSSVLVPSATGVVSERSLSEFRGDIGAIGGSIASGQVAFGTGADQIGGSPRITWDNTNALLDINGQNVIPRILIRSSSLTTSQAEITRSGSDFIIRNLSNASVQLWTNNLLRWSVLNNGILESNGAQTLRTSTGNLIISTGGGNGNINMAPNGTGQVDIFSTLRIRTINNLGTAPASVLVPSATGVVSERSLSEFGADLGSVFDTRYLRKDVADIKQNNLTIENGFLSISRGGSTSTDGTLRVETNRITNDSNSFVTRMFSGENNELEVFRIRNDGLSIFRGSAFQFLTATGVEIFSSGSPFSANHCNFTRRVSSSERSSIPQGLIRRDELYLNYPQTINTTGTINNLELNESCKLLRLTGADDLTGIVLEDGRLIRIEARGGNRIIRNENTGSSASNRFSIGSDLTINDGEVYQFIKTNNRIRRVL